jgi:hypothetical protein
MRVCGNERRESVLLCSTKVVGAQKVINTNSKDGESSSKGNGIDLSSIARKQCIVTYAKQSRQCANDRLLFNRAGYNMNLKPSINITFRNLDLPGSTN